VPNLAANSTVEGRAIVEAELRLPNSKIVPFNRANLVHVRSTITESIKKPSEHELVFRAPSTDYVDNIIRHAQSLGTPKLRYRVGIGLPGNMVFLPWQDQIISDFTAILEGVGTTAGHYCRMSLGDHLVTIARKARVTSRRGRISRIVEQLARENGLNSLIIEDTEGEGMWIQSFESDFDFIRHRLLPRAVNGKGRGNYSLYIRDNTLHFHSPDYHAELKELIYYQANTVGLTQMDESQAQLEHGASGAVLVVYDPYTAQSKEVLSDPAKALRLGNTMHKLSNVRGSEFTMPYHLSTNSPMEAEHLAQSIYENARSQALGLKLDISRSLFLRVGDILRIAISPVSGKNTVWSGTYLVTDSCTVIESGAVTASFIVKRGEFQTSSTRHTSIQIYGDNVILNEEDAPGQPLNLKAVQSSRITRGSGQATFTSVFVDSRSPSSAPNPNPKF
jgi:hypothetical protein